MAHALHLQSLQLHTSLYVGSWDLRFRGYGPLAGQPPRRYIPCMAACTAQRTVLSVPFLHSTRTNVPQNVIDSPWALTVRMHYMQSSCPTRRNPCRPLPVPQLPNAADYNVVAPTPEGEAELMEQLAFLPHLRSLSLTLHALYGWKAHLAPRLLSCATCLKNLGALTALTRLELQLHPVSQPWGDSYKARDTTRLLPIYDDEEALEDAVLAALDQRKASLLHALLCMPSLQHLSCTGLWLTPAELAQLTPLTHLELEGLLPPTADEAAALLLTSSNPPVWDLPPHLQQLRLIGLSASVRALAAIRPPCGGEQQRPRCRLQCLCLHFGTGDVAANDGRLLPGAAAAVGRAVEVLRAAQPRAGEWTLQVVADGSKWPMGPPGSEGQQQRQEEGQEQGEGQGEEQQGHAGWLRQFRTAGEECTGLVLQDLAMRAGDLAALVQALPQLKVGPGVAGLGRGLMCCMRLHVPGTNSRGRSHRCLSPLADVVVQRTCLLFPGLSCCCTWGDWGQRTV